MNNIYTEFPWWCSSYILDHKLKNKKMFTPMQVQGLIQYAEEQRLIAERHKFESEKHHKKFLKMKSLYKKQKEKDVPTANEKKKALEKAIKENRRILSSKNQSDFKTKEEYINFKHTHRTHIKSLEHMKQLL